MPQALCELFFQKCQSNHCELGRRGPWCLGSMGYSWTQSRTCVRSRVNVKAGYAASAFPDSTSVSNHMKHNPKQHNPFSQLQFSSPHKGLCMILRGKDCLCFAPLALCPAQHYPPKGATLFMLMLMRRIETITTTLYSDDILVPDPELSTLHPLFF